MRGCKSKQVSIKENGDKSVLERELAKDSESSIFLNGFELCHFCLCPHTLLLSHSYLSFSLFLQIYLSIDRYRVPQKKCLIAKFGFWVPIETVCS